MNTSSRFLAVAALLATLAACGNKGPLVHPSAAEIPADSTPTPSSPPSTDPDTTLPQQNANPPAGADEGATPPTTPVTPVPPPPPSDSSGGNG